MGSRVNVVASKITYDGKRKIATATGRVEIVYGRYTLTATMVIYDMDNDTFKANGSVILREPNGNVLQADYAELTDKFKEGFARHIKGAPDQRRDHHRRLRKAHRGWPHHF